MRTFVSGSYNRVRVTSKHVAVTFASLALVSPVASAFNPPGHFDTVTAIFSGIQAFDSSVMAEKRIEAFCNQLPDMSMELDAVTQREHVATSLRDWGWTSLTSVGLSRRVTMVASQFYLHALGSNDYVSVSSADVRKAAIDLLARLDDDIQSAGTPQDRANLWCARGFAGHLLGDTYAHSTTEDESGTTPKLNDDAAANAVCKPNAQAKDYPILYKTGMGHSCDLHEPDFGLCRPRVWENWADEVSNSLAPGVHNGLPHAVLANLLFNTSAEGDTQLASRLLNEIQAQDQAYWVNWETTYKRSPDKWTDSPNPSNLPLGLGAAVNLYNGSVLQTKCDDQIKKGPANRVNGGGLNPIALDGALPNCHEVWKIYLQKAQIAFAGIKDAQHPKGLQPVCDIGDDNLENGQ